MIFIWIFLGIVIYLLCGFGCDILCSWYEKKYANVEAYHTETTDIALWFIWPFILITILWLIFSNKMCRITNKITEKMYAKMDERSKKNGKKD